MCKGHRAGAEEILFPPFLLSQGNKEVLEACGRGGSFLCNILERGKEEEPEEQD